MAAASNNPARNDSVVISPRDILFECPACHKSLVIDEAAQGMIVDCPQCHTNVIVPPKSASLTPAGAAAAAAPSPSPAVEPPAQPAGELSQSVEPHQAELLARLVTLGNQLKELQTQRTEISTNVAARLNEINRQMVMLARQETAHHQLLTEWNQILGQIKGSGQRPAAPGKSQANFKA